MRVRRSENFVMFELDWGKLVVIAIVALVVIGPKDLPAALRTLGQWTAKLRRMASEFQSQFHEAMREAEMADLKKQVDEMASQAQSYANFDPVGEVRKELDSTQQHIERAIADNPPATPTPSVAAEPPVSLPSSSESAPPDAASHPETAATSESPPDVGGKPA
jgi:sec-independent protein translocase protein TatB